MRFLVSLVCCVGFCAAFISLARAEAVLDRQLAQFEQVAEAWFVNNRCKIFDGSGAQEFEWHVAVINIALTRKTGGPATSVAIQRRGMNRAGQPSRNTCDKATQLFVGQSMNLARNLSFELSGRRYDATSNRDYQLAQMQIITRSFRVAKRCGYEPPQIRAEVDRVYDRELSGLADRFGTRAVNAMLDRVAKELVNGNPPCNKMAEQQYVQSLQELRALERALRR